VKLLIVDDDAVSRSALKELIGTPPKWEILEAEDGQQALDLLEQGVHPDVCIVDLKMPRVSGTEFIQKLRQKPETKNAKVLATSSTRDRETIVGLAALQISGYLLKPYDPQKTRALIQPLIPVAAADPRLASRNLLQKTLLVVDDDKMIHAAFQSLISPGSGWEYIACFNGQEALDRLHAGLRPDLIVTDLTMPRLGGVAFITHVRADPHLERLRIAVVSGETDREKVQQLAKLKIFSYLLKPFDKAKIDALLEKASS
jgi:CheY-like chemotaxis protein